MLKKLAVVFLVSLFGLAQAAPVATQSMHGTSQQTTHKKNSAKKSTQKKQGKHAKKTKKSTAKKSSRTKAMG